MSLSSLLCSEISKRITNYRIFEGFFWKICNRQQSCFFFFLSKKFFFSYFIHRSLIQYWIIKNGIIKKGGKHFSNKWFKSFYRHECSISKKVPTIHFETIYVLILVVERVPCRIWTSNSLALTMLMVPHYWLIRESKWIYQ